MTATSPTTAEHHPSPQGRIAARTLAVVTVLVGVVFRFVCPSELWLDEALTVNIASLPVSQIPAALKVDGAPPLYYLLLHYWMLATGDGTWAVRALPGIFSVLTLGVVGVLAHRLGGHRAVWPSVLALATNPFALRYATEARMYSLVMLLASLGILAMLWALDKPVPLRLIPVSLVTAALLYTHYWGLFLNAATGLLLLWWAASNRDGHRQTFLKVAGAMVAGGLLWLPWVPTFLYQAQRTGTPWASPAGPGALVNLLSEFTGGLGEASRLLALLLWPMVVVALFAMPAGRFELLFDLRTRRPARWLAAICLGAPAIAVAAGLASGSAFIGRYTSVVLPMFVLLVGIGVSRFVSRRVRSALLAAICLLGFGAAGRNAFINERTQAPLLAAAIRNQVRPDDVIGYCPDQLGVATNRLLEKTLSFKVQSITWPNNAGPRLIDWTDYSEANSEASPTAFAKALVDRAGPNGTVWLVTSDAYSTAATACPTVAERLGQVRPLGRLRVPAQGRYFERAWLYEYPPSPANPADAVIADGRPQG